VAVWQPCELLYTCYLLTQCPGLGSSTAENIAKFFHLCGAGPTVTFPLVVCGSCTDVERLVICASMPCASHNGAPCRTAEPIARLAWTTKETTHNESTDVLRTVAPPRECDYTIRARRRCGHMSNYLGHLFYGSVRSKLNGFRRLLSECKTHRHGTVAIQTCVRSRRGQRVFLLFLLSDPRLVQQLSLVTDRQTDRHRSVAIQT